jgi:hypothetical protein
MTPTEAIHGSEPVSTLGSRMGDMFDLARVRRLVLADCARRPFALAIIGERGTVITVHLFETEEKRATALPLLHECINRNFVPMGSTQAMRSMSSFIREALDR